MTLSTIFISCKKENSDDVSSANLATGKCKITATVNELKIKLHQKEFTISSSTVFPIIIPSDLISTAARSSGILNISGGTSSLPIQLFMFLLPAEVPVGTYNFATDRTDIKTVSYSKTDISGATVAGAAANDRDNQFTIVITKSTATELEATFSGTLYNEDDETSFPVTNGKLAAKF